MAGQAFVDDAAVAELGLEVHQLLVGAAAHGIVDHADEIGLQFEVEDFEQAIKRLKDRHIPFAAEPFETPCCHMAVVQDPDGNKLMIHKLKSENEKEPCL